MGAHAARNRGDLGRPVCNHLTMQKAVVEFRHVVTALEVALMPSEAYDKEKSAAGRVAALSAFRCYKPKLHTVYLPPAYEQELRFLYSELDDNRNILISDQSIPSSIRSRGIWQYSILPSLPHGRTDSRFGFRQVYQRSRISGA